MPSSLIVRSSLKSFHVHQLAATNSMHLQSTYVSHLQHLFNRRRIWNLVEHLWWNFFAEIKAVDYFRRGAPSWMFDEILEARLSNNLL